jgi:DNA-nicking Smr family endonuclease
VTRDHPPKRHRPASTGDDHALWAEIARSVKPLPGKKGATPAAPADTSNTKAPRRAPQPAQPAVWQRPAPPPLAPIDRRMRQRLSRGAAPVDARLDLHGLTQAAARARLQGFLEAAQARGNGLVLVITGKGATGDDGERERGVLRRQVPLWLALPEMRSLVIGFEEAGRGHGGAGALYVRVRKRRP